jgi:hypothetical protein
MHFREYAHHHLVGVIIGLFCIWLSLSLIIRLWLVHKGDSLPKKLMWSLVLSIPFFGWLLYGAFYTPLNANDARVGLRWH